MNKRRQQTIRLVAAAGAAVLCIVALIGFPSAAVLAAILGALVGGVGTKVVFLFIDRRSPSEPTSAAPEDSEKVADREWNVGLDRDALQSSATSPPRRKLDARWHSIATCAVLVALALLYALMLGVLWDEFFDETSIVLTCTGVLIFLSYLVLVPAVVLKDRFINVKRHIAVLNVGIVLYALLTAAGSMIIIGRIIVKHLSGYASWPAVSCDRKEEAKDRTTSRPVGPEERVLAQANNEFTLDLYHQVRNRAGNIFLSPYSISTAIAMTYAGARENTARQMAHTLHFSLHGDKLHAAFASLRHRMEAIQIAGHGQILVANSLWPEKSHVFLQPYLDLAKTCYGVTIAPLDYRNHAEKARRTINAWIEDRTKNTIKGMISSVDPQARMVLANAIYFKGDWLRKFSKRATEDQPFYIATDKMVTAPLMTFRPGGGVQMPEFGYWADQTLQVLELPYIGGDLTMIVLLPREKDGLAELEESLTVANMEKWTGHLNQQKVRVYFPKFKMTWGTTDLTGALTALGMADPFSPEKADFSGMDGNKHGGSKDWLYISQLLHKAFVAVNEEGTEAAAVSVISAVAGAARGHEPPTFRADHPFLFFIREQQTGCILFMGRMADPSERQ